MQEGGKWEKQGRKASEPSGGGGCLEAPGRRGAGCWLGTCRSRSSARHPQQACVGVRAGISLAPDPCSLLARLTCSRPLCGRWSRPAAWSSAAEPACPWPAAHTAVGGVGGAHKGWWGGSASETDGLCPRRRHCWPTTPVLPPHLPASCLALRSCAICGSSAAHCFSTEPHIPYWSLAQWAHRRTSL